MTTQVEKTAACRICAGQCSLVISLDSAGKMNRIRGDKSNPVTRGYACIKGLTLHEAHYAPDRILHPLRRRKDGGFERVPLNVALDEIAARVADILAAHGPDAVAGFRGTMNYTNSIANQMLPDWLAAMGSHSFFSTMTIDQSAKWITAGRLGSWEAGKDPYEVSDVLLLFGANPLVSLSTFTLTMQNPVKAIREAKARDVVIVVVDPRKTETAAFADILAQPLPGEDVTFVAGMLHTIFQESWHDADFCAAYADGVEALRHAVEPFSPAYVSARTGVPIADLRAAVEAFAAPLQGRRKRGAAVSGTGPNMAAHSNLAEHLIECLNVVCGRYARAGDRVMNPGVLGPRRQYRAQVRPPTRGWETGWKDANGYGRIFGERMTATLPDAIMNSGAGQVRALFVDGGNPANALADTSRTRHALAALDLLVAIDPFMTETATLAHYVLPPPMMFERPDIGSRDWETFTLMTPYAQYSEAVIAPPEGSETIEDWRLFWEVARRTGHNIMFDGVPLDRDKAPEAEELISILLRHSALPLHEIRAATKGAVFNVPAMTVLPGLEKDRFNIAPQDVLTELTNVAAEPFAKESLRLAVRRMRDVQNSMYHQLPELERRVPENPVWMNPEDMEERGITDHALVHISSAHGMVEGHAVGDATLRRGVASMTHGWGGGRGVNVNNLTSLVKDCDPINAMPVLTGFPITIQLASRGH